MDARAKTVREILHASDQYLIPFFQRSYSWTRKHWARLWDDLVGLLEDGQISQHFLGPLVCTLYRSVPGEVPAYLLIDGQQRMTTLVLLLAALRDVAKGKGHPGLAEEIQEDYLIHKRKPGLQRYKVVPRLEDRDSLIAIVDEKEESRDGDMLTRAKRFFQRHIEHRLEKRGADVLRDVFTAATDRLALVVITIDGENPYEIFESLNSTGLPLEESDLVRNFIFMQVPTPNQDAFHREHWKPLEDRLAAKGDSPAISLTQFYRSYLMRSGTYLRKGAAFVGFKEQNLRRKLSPEDQASELRRFAEYELWLRRPVTCPKTDAKANLRKRLARVQMLEITTAHPLLMTLFDRNANGELSDEKLCACIDDLCSFVLRRCICGETTRSYGRWFVDAIRTIKDDARGDLQKYWLQRGWPDEDAFVPMLVDFPVYRRERLKAKLMLNALEEAFENKEIVDLDNTSIEHVMPQVLSGQNGLAWKAMLGPDWEDAHARLLHTLGNLTLTAYNPDMANKPFAQKQKWLADVTHIDLNKHFKGLGIWDGGAIRGRGELLAEQVAKLWPRPEGGQYVLPRGGQDRKLSPDQRRAYWTGFLGSGEWDRHFRVPKSSRSGNIRFRVRKLKGPRFVCYMLRSKRIGVMVSLPGKNAEGVWNQLRDEKAELEAAAGFPLVWEEDSRGAHYISSGRPADLLDESQWPEQHAWLGDALLGIRRAFVPWLRELVGPGTVSGTKQLRVDYWTALRARLLEENSHVKPRKPLPDNWTTFRIGRSYFGLWASMSVQKKRLVVGLGCYGPNAKKNLQTLQADRGPIESAIGGQLEWHLLPHRKESKVTIVLEDTDPSDRADWPRQHEWLVKQLEAFHTTFAPRVQGLSGKDSDSEPSE